MIPTSDSPAPTPYRWTIKTASGCTVHVVALHTAIPVFPPTTFSDVDLFVIASTPETYAAIIQAALHVLRIHFGRGRPSCMGREFRPPGHSTIQLIRFPYTSVASIIAAFDIASVACAHDGNRMWLHTAAVWSHVNKRIFVGESGRPCPSVRHPSTPQPSDTSPSYTHRPHVQTPHTTPPAAPVRLPDCGSTPCVRGTPYLCRAH